MPKAGASHTTHRRWSRLPRWAWLVALCVVFGAVTSVGVAWWIAWQRPSLTWSSHPTEGIQIIRGADGLTERLGWVVTRGGWDFGRGPLVVNCFSTSQSKGLQEYIDEKRERFGFDLTESFTSLARDAAGKRALARHLPLVQTVDGDRVYFEVMLAGWPLRCLALEEACTLKDAIDRKRGMYFSSGTTDAPTHIPNPKATITDPAFNLLPHYNAIEVGDHLLPTFPLWPGLFANTAIYGGAWAVLIFTPLFVRRWLRARKGGCAGCGYSREGLKAGAPCPECGRHA